MMIAKTISKTKAQTIGIVGVRYTVRLRMKSIGVMPTCISEGSEDRWKGFEHSASYKAHREVRKVGRAAAANGHVVAELAHDDRDEEDRRGRVEGLHLVRSRGPAPGKEQVIREVVERGAAGVGRRRRDHCRAIWTRAPREVVERVEESCERDCGHERGSCKCTKHTQQS